VNGRGAHERTVGPAPRGDAGVLAVDVGAGTADILLTRAGEPLENAVKLVVPSRTQVVAQQIRRATNDGATVVFSGPVMGGGACTAAMRQHLAAGQAFVATPSAALTFADDLDHARRLGVEVVSDEEAERLLHAGPGVEHVRSGDLDGAALLDALALLGVEPSFHACAVAVQDHGFSPDGSNRVARFALWEQAVADARPLTVLFYDETTLPPELTRLLAAHDAARSLATCVLVADTGPAALYGAMPPGRGDAVVVNVGNGHTMCAVARDGRLHGVFEHHTRLLDGPGLGERLRRFLAGELTSDEVREDGGHGAVLAGPVAGAPPLIATGPRRALLEASALPFEFAAPHGDMMLTGCFGLLRAFEERRHTKRSRRDSAPSTPS
jgi:uncharacterized protein (DUF1786 family)